MSRFKLEKQWNWKKFRYQWAVMAYQTRYKYYAGWGRIRWIKDEKDLEDTTGALRILHALECGKCPIKIYPFGSNQRTN